MAICGGGRTWKPQLGVREKRDKSAILLCAVLRGPKTPKFYMDNLRTLGANSLSIFDLFAREFLCITDTLEVCGH